MSEETVDVRRIRCVKVPLTMLTVQFKKGLKFEVLEGLPEDAMLVQTEYEPVLDRVMLFFESKEFDVVPEGSMASDLTIKFKKL